MSLFQGRNSLTLILLLSLTSYFIIITSHCKKDSVPLDAKLKIPNDDIEKIVKFRKGTTFKIKDPATKRIGEVKYGSILVMKDVPEDITERLVFLKVLKRSSERYLIKIITKRGETPHTEEFIIDDGQTNKSCTKVFRDAIDVDIRNIDDTSIRSTYSQLGWDQYSIRNELAIQYRIGNIHDGDSSVVRDGSNLNIRMRFFHVSKTDLKSLLISRCLPCLTPTKPTIIRVFTYYYIGERSFDEYVGKYESGKKVYVELVRQPVNLNLARRDSGHFKRSKIDSETFVYSISDEYKNYKKIGRVVNNKMTIVDDSDDVRLRSVYTNINDTEFEQVEVKSCYKKGDCKRCKYILEDNKYNETTCKRDRESAQDVGSSSKVFVSKEQLDEGYAKKKSSYITDVLSFKDRKDADNQIVVDINEAKSREFTIDLMPQTQALYYSLNKEHAGKDLYVRISNASEFIVTIHLHKVNEVDFIVKNSESGQKRIFLWIKCGLELFKGHDYVVIDTLNQSSEYKSKKISTKKAELISTMIN